MVFIVDLLDRKPNWFKEILIIPLRQCSVTLSHSFIVIPLILPDQYQYTSPLAKHFVRPEDMIEQLGWP
jgi:hypothetical protein